ncbi:MAG: cupredoxin domain-containing protein [Candidatus Limnocylindrales bacterium]
MLQLWDQLLHLLSFLVIPDWGALISLLPVGVAIIVAGYLVWSTVRLMSAPPTRRGRRRLPPRVPDGVHVGPSSPAPLLVSASAAILFLGLVFRGPLLVAGLVAIVLSLLYWGREAMHDYDRLVHRELAPVGGEVPAPGPPAGVHLPGPSFRPILASVASAILFLGLVLGPPILLAGVVMLVIVLLGWLSDARSEYRAVVRADATGHLDQTAAPAYPIGTLLLLATVLVLALVVQAGIFPPREPSTSAGAGPTPAAAASSAAGGPGGSPAASGSTGGSTGGGGLQLAASNIAFDKQSLTAPANTPFTLVFDNRDAGIPHNVEIKDASGASKFKGDLVTGPAKASYSVPALPAGSYTFVCDVHTSMTGTLTVR